MKKTMVIASMAVLALGLAACKKETASTETTETTIVDGVTVETTTTETEYVDDDGVTTYEVETETTVDPEGLLNEETVEEETYVIEPIQE